MEPPEPMDWEKITTKEEKHSADLFSSLIPFWWPNVISTNIYEVQAMLEFRGSACASLQINFQSVEPGGAAGQFNSYCDERCDSLKSYGSTLHLYAETPAAPVVYLPPLLPVIFGVFVLLFFFCLSFYTRSYIQRPTKKWAIEDLILQWQGLSLTEANAKRYRDDDMIMIWE